MHESGDNEFANMVTDMKSFKYINHEIVPRKEIKKNTIGDISGTCIYL